MHMQQEITAAIQKALAALGLPVGQAGVSFVVDRPTDLLHGDYYTNVAMVVFGFRANNSRKEGSSVRADDIAIKVKIVGDTPVRHTFSSPHELAQHLKKELHGKIDGVEKIEVAGPGFINFFLSRDAVVAEVQKAATDASWGSNTLQQGKTVMVEYTSPNVFKPLHIGNLVGNIIGEAIARLLTAAGAEVKRINYPSDIGLTVAKGVWGLRKGNLDPGDIAQLGQAYVLGSAAYDESPEQKAEIEEVNRALYARADPELDRLRAMGIETSYAHLNAICKTLGTTFDAVIFESQSAPKGLEIVEQAEKSGIFEKSDGAIIFRGEKEGLHTRVFVNSQGLPTYEAKDIGLFALKRAAFPSFDTSVTVTGKEQSEYFKIIFVAIRKVFAQETVGKELRHVPTGLLKLTTGKMSSRKGNVITGESLLLDLKEAAKEKMRGRELPDADKVAEQVAVGAIKYAVLKQGSGKDIIFDPEKSLSLEGDSGPYLQYALVRARSLIKKAIDAGITDATPDGEHARDAIEALVLDRILLHFPEVVEHAVRELEPHYVTTYLTEMAAAFNSWYAKTRVIGGEYPSYALTLARAFEHTMSRGLALLGIPAPEEM